MSLLITRGLGSGPGLIVQGLENDGQNPVVVNGIELFNPFKGRLRGIQFANVLDKSNSNGADIGGAPGPAREHNNAVMAVYMAQEGVGLRQAQGGSYSGAIKYRFRDPRSFPIPTSILGQGNEIFPFTGGPAPVRPSFCDFMWNSASLPLRYFFSDSIAKFGDGRIVTMEIVNFDGYIEGVTPTRSNIFSANGLTAVTGGFSTNPIASSSAPIAPFGIMCSMGDGRVLRIAASLSASSFDSIWVETIDPTTLQWTARPAPMNFDTSYQFDSHDGITLTQMDDGNVLKVGGRVNNAVLTSGSSRYNYATDTWTTRAVMNQARVLHTTTKLLDGRLLVVGGFSEGNDGAPMVECEVYNPGTNTWTIVASMSQARYGHRAVLLANGHVLVVGFDDFFSPELSKTAEVYDPFQNMWSAAPNLSSSRYDAALLTAEDGNAYLLGGVSGNFQNTKEILAYSYLTNAWYERGSTLYYHQEGQSNIINVGGCTFLAIGSTFPGQTIPISASELSSH